MYRSLEPVCCACSQRILLLVHVCARTCLAVYVRLTLCENVSICLPARVCVCLRACVPVCVFLCVRASVCTPSPPALKHQQQITDGPPALEVFYFPAEARYVKNKHVQH